MRTAEDLLQELCSLDESHRIEAKRASQIARSVMETVCAFSNEPGLGGGYLLLGVARDPHDLFSNAYVVEGIENPDQLQSDLAWLRRLTFDPLSDEEARALVFVRELGAIDNAAYRAINRTDTLNASAHLRRLRTLDLLAMKGSSRCTYYEPGPAFVASLSPSQADTHQPAANRHQPDPNSHHPLATIPETLRVRVPPPGSKPRRDVLRTLIQDLCRWRALSARDLAAILGRREHKPLVRDHLSPMVAEGLLVYTIPEMENHPDQRYTAPGQEPTNTQAEP